MALQDILQLPSRAEGHDDMLSPIMALRIMHSLINTTTTSPSSSISNSNSHENKKMIPDSTGCLNYAQLVSFGQASIFCLSEVGIGDTENDGSESKTDYALAEMRTVSACCLVLSSLLTVTASASVSAKQLTTLNYTVVNGVSSKPAMRAIVRLLSCSNTNSNTTTPHSMTSSSIQCYTGDIGALDGVLALLCASATAQLSTPSSSSSSSSSSHKGMALLPTASLVTKQLQNAGNGQISPLGTISAMKFIASILASTAITSALPGREGDTKTPSLSVLSFANTEGLTVILSFICLPLHLDSCVAWCENQPNYQNTGQYNSHSPIDVIDGLLASAGDILKIIMTAISTPPTQSPQLSPAGVQSTAAAQDSQKILEGIYRSQLIKCLLQALNSKRSLSGRVVASIVHVLSELVLTSSKFMAQFVECSGLEIVVEVGSNMTVMEGKRDVRHSREKDGSAEEQVTVCMLQMSSHLARHSEKHFEILQAIFTPLRIIQLLSQVRSNIFHCVFLSFLIFPSPTSHLCQQIFLNGFLFMSSFNGSHFFYLVIFYWKKFFMAQY